MDDCKYIVFESTKFALEYPIIFPEYVSHADVKVGFDKAISAGFVAVDTAELKLHAYGEAVTLKLKSRMFEDSELLNRLLKSK